MTTYGKDFKKIKRWVENKGFDLVVSNDGDYVSFVDKVVVVNKRSSKENMIFSLLHECGHICQRQKMRNYFNDFKHQLLGNDDRRKSRSYSYRVSVLEEEFDAWKRGRRLAKRLKINIDEDNYQRYKSRCIVTYAEWLTSRDWYWQC